MRLYLITAVVLAASGGAVAQMSQSPSDATAQSSHGSSQQPLPQRIQQKLKSQGFTDVKVVPEGYIVSAKDKDGDPVTMIIGPNSIAMFTVAPSSTSSNQSSSNQSPSNRAPDSSR